MVMTIPKQKRDRKETWSPPRDCWRGMIIVRYTSGETPREIAAAMGCSESTVRRRLAEASLLPEDELGSLSFLRPYGRDGRRKRDDQIRELRGKGVPVVRLAKYYKLGRQAIYKILWRGRSAKFSLS